MAGRVVLLQARDPDDPMLEHELGCFVARSGLPPTSFISYNLAELPPDEGILDEFDMVMVGGSGDYSVVKGGFDWHDDMLDLMRAVVRRRVPMFASCFGFQALIQSLGGEVITCEQRSEMGTFTISLTDHGARDPLFSNLPRHFEAQLGHNDSAVALPEDLVCLADSTRCEHQAVRHRGAPIVATQFHPELTHEDNIHRYLRYLASYKDPNLTMEEARQRAHSMHRPSPHANGLLRRFVEVFLDP